MNHLKSKFQSVPTEEWKKGETNKVATKTENKNPNEKVIFSKLIQKNNSSQDYKIAIDEVQVQIITHI